MASVLVQTFAKMETDDEQGEKITSRATGQDRLPPVRVKVFRADGKVAQVHPPDGEGENWWHRLNKALGTRSATS